MKSLVATPFIPMSKSMASHRSAQGIIYTDQLSTTGIDVTPNMSLEFYYEDFNLFDALYVYHGNDWFGHLNLFGGLKEFPHIDNFVNFSKFKGKVYSLSIPFPDYYDQLKHKVDLAKNKDKVISPLWDSVDWDNIKRMESESELVVSNELIKYPNISIGDSHAICMYRPEWMNISVPYKTLYGALEIGLDSFIEYEHDFDNIEYYFGNIDVRHHLLRQENPQQATVDIVDRYIKQAEEVAEKRNATVTLYELLPIENERRSIPKTGWYEGTSFYGSRQERNEIRILFRDELKKRASEKVKIFEWVDDLINDVGELDFKYMEKPKSVHLSRQYYPHWQGNTWNLFNVVDNSSFNLEEFL
tara:strand:- start:7995 stop:9068 length:1074 start_codon:yes stop_codon:yes gene_type:complete